MLIDFARHTKALLRWFKVLAAGKAGSFWLPASLCIFGVASLVGVQSVKRVEQTDAWQKATVVTIPTAHPSIDSSV
eukprot:277956-Pleurochrysis_carterae.AAC.1